VVSPSLQLCPEKTHQSMYRTASASATSCMMGQHLLGPPRCHQHLNPAGHQWCSAIFILLLARVGASTRKMSFILGFLVISSMLLVTMRRVEGGVLNTSQMPLWAMSRLVIVLIQSAGASLMQMVIRLQFRHM